MKSRPYLAYALAALAAFAVSVGIVRAAFTTVGPQFIVYSTPVNGTGNPPAANDPASFNTQVYGSAIPPNASLQAGTPSNYDGTSIDLTANGNQPVGTTIVPSCAGFTYSNGSGCVAPSNPNPLTNTPLTFIAVQSWPFYVGPSGSTSSNITEGTFGFETSTDDGSWLVLAGSPYTYAQPGNFNNTTALTPGTAVVNNGGLHGPAAVFFSFNIPTTGQCPTNLYYLTFEYFEGAGGQAQVGYQWQPPGAGAYQNVPQTVLYGQALYNGAADAGAVITVPLPAGGTATLTTDARGCFGYNFPTTFAGTTTLTNIKGTDTAAHGGTVKTQSLPLTMGSATYAEFDFPNPVPNITLYKRITQVIASGATITPTPDPGPTALAGTVSYKPGLKPGDTVTYTIYFSNAGSIPAKPQGALTGPQITDVLASSLTLLSVANGTCCVLPTSSIAVTGTSSGNTATWTFAAPLPTTNPHSPLSIQGSVSVTAKVK